MGRPGQSAYRSGSIPDGYRPVSTPVLPGGRRTACRTGLCGGRPSARDGSLLSLSEEINELDASKEMVGITSMGEVDEEIAGNVDFASRPTGAQRRNLEEQFQRSVRGNGKPSGSER